MFLHLFSVCQGDAGNREKAETTMKYSVKGSYGTGRWTKVPWIAVFDTRHTSSAQQGVYVVYLINKDTQELYLVLETAATEVIAKNSTASLNGSDNLVSNITAINNAQMKEALAEKVDTIRPYISNSVFNEDDKINSGSPGYNYGAICYKKFTHDSLPSDDVLLSDLKEILNLYSNYVTHLQNTKSVNDAPVDYSPGITKEKWLEILNDENIIGPVWGSVLAMFFTEKRWSDM